MVSNVCVGGCFFGFCLFCFDFVVLICLDFFVFFYRKRNGIGCMGKQRGVGGWEIITGIYC